MSPTSGVVGDIGGDLVLCRLLALLFGRGGGGSPPAAGPSALFGDGGREERKAGGWLLSEGAREARVCSSNSRAARKLGEIIMFLDRGRGISGCSLWSSAANGATLMT